MMDLPPTNQPQPQAMIQKINKSDHIIKEIKTQCENSVNDGFKNYNNPIPRALFVDICNTENYQVFFQYKVIFYLLHECMDALGLRAYDMPPYHVSESDIYYLQDISKDGIGSKSVGRIPSGSVSYSLSERAFYSLLKDNPEVTPKFTKFICGKTPADMPPVRLEDGTPNPEFFRVWHESTQAFLDAKPDPRF